MPVGAFLERNLMVGCAASSSSPRNWKPCVFSSSCNCCSFWWERGVVLWAGLSVGEGLDDEDRCCFHPKDEGLDNVWCCLNTTGELGGSDKCCCCFHPRWAGLLADIAKRTLSSVDVGERVIFSGGVGVTVEVCRRGGLGDVATGGQSGS